MSIKTTPTYPMNLDEEGRLIMLTPEELRLSKIDQKIDLTRENHGESPLYSASETILTDFKTPIHNMRVKMHKI